MIIHELTINYNQLIIRSLPANLDLQEWGDGNIAQGIIYHENYITFDPLVEEDFGAYVGIEVVSELVADPNAQRIVEIPFKISDLSNLVIGSVFNTIILSPKPLELDSAVEESFGRYYLNERLPLIEDTYSLLFQVCIGNINQELPEEVYYRFSFCNQKKLENRVWKDDNWGLKQNDKIQEGKF